MDATNDILGALDIHCVGTMFVLHGLANGDTTTNLEANHVALSSTHSKVLDSLVGTVQQAIEASTDGAIV